VSTPEQSISSATQQEASPVHPIHVEEMQWIEPPQHFGAYSKMLVNPDNSSTRYFDFRLSLYQPKSHVEDHVHAYAEHVYYILQGRGLITLDGKPYVVGAHEVIFIPPGVVHSLSNTGLENLLFIVVTVPAGELPRSERLESEHIAMQQSNLHNGESTKS
jgi:mannose-6-phosphate isomerase-like protein (cupin superfamily)